ncbi:hypothetical protein MKW98_001747 [Papaver atlanticum]|uniref:BTB/POZ domain-containing protein n=1 Tax=Papaver atlanticum TaxID=357466 RepID=A0AAD4S6A4_9MAGN|nr:hypothetical protein MKW98_001747 [Papaver atlanticum]
MSLLTRVGPLNLNATKNVFLSAIRYATSVDVSSLSFVVQLKTSAQEQVDYMLVADEDMPLVVADSEVISEVEMGLSRLLLLFTELLVSVPLESGIISEADENMVLQSLLDIEWMCNMLSKMELMRVFVSSWFNVSGKILSAIESEKFDSIMWGVKLKLIEIAGKVLDAVSYGNVILPAASRVALLKIWLPYMRKMKHLLDLKVGEDIGFSHKMNETLCESIEGAMVSLVSALPSNDQAEILSDWMMKAKQLKFPDLSEAFEVWCYRTKSAKRRLLAGFSNVDEAAISL